MGSSMGFAKTILIPAVIALTVYLLFTLLIIPFFRRYQQRYSQYLPLHAISAHTVSLRDRIADTVMRLFLPSSWRRGAHLDEHDNISIDDEEGELMTGLNMDAVRREALEQRRGLGLDSNSNSNHRLSRELEEGFMDDSDDDDERGERGRGQH